MLRSLKAAYYEGRQDAREQIDDAAKQKTVT